MIQPERKSDFLIRPALTIIQGIHIIIRALITRHGITDMATDIRGITADITGDIMATEDNHIPAMAEDIPAATAAITGTS